MTHYSPSVLYGLLGLFEATVILAGLSLMLFLRLRRRQARVRALEKALTEARERVCVIRQEAATAPAVEGGEYVAHLERELAASKALLGEDVFAHLTPVSGDPGEDRRRLLAIRHRFLELEHQGQLIHGDPQGREALWQRGLEDLFARVLPEPAGEGAPSLAGRRAAPTLAELRRALGEQHGLVAELRRMLEGELEGSEQAEDILARLQEAEAQGREMERLLEQLEQDASSESEVNESTEAELLRDLVGSQQETIADLESLLREALPEGGASVNLLEETLERIQRTNKELGTCVTVLEDENARLREEVSALRDQLAALEEPAAKEGTLESGNTPGTEQTADAVVDGIDGQKAAQRLEAEVETDAADEPETPVEAPESPRQVDLDESAEVVVADEPVRVAPPTEIDLAAEEEAPDEARLSGDDGDAGQPSRATAAGEKDPADDEAPLAARTGTEGSAPAPDWTRDL